MNSFIFDFLLNGDVSEWKPHPNFPGVMLAETKYESDNSWRTLLVKVDCGKGLLPHIHETETEFHFVINGTAKARRGDELIDYNPGQIHRIPSSIEHEVIAGYDGLTMVAIFIKD